MVGISLGLKVKPRLNLFINAGQHAISFIIVHFIFLFCFVLRVQPQATT